MQAIFVKWESELLIQFCIYCVSFFESGIKISAVFERRSMVYHFSDSEKSSLQVHCSKRLLPHYMFFHSNLRSDQNGATSLIISQIIVCLHIMIQHFFAALKSTVRPLL